MARDRPRVLLVTPDFPPERGGIQTLAHRLVVHAKRLDARVVTLPAASSCRFDAAQPIAIRRSRVTGPGRRAAVLGLNGFAILEGLRFRPRAVISAHIVVSPAARGLARLTGSATVQYLHADELRGRPALARFAVTHADAVIAVSSYTERLALETGASAARVHRILNGVDPVAERPFSERETRPTLLTVARLDSPYKGLDVTMRALPLIRGRVPEAQWVIVGDGRLRPHLEGQARSLGRSGPVTFLGSVSDSERDSWLRRAHVFVMPSSLPATGVGGEGFGIVYLEANAHGLPVVAGNVGGALDAVIDGRTGVLVDPRDHVALADAVSDLLLDRRRAAELARMGRERARQMSWEAVARQVEAVVLHVAGR
jgi:phosphatidylinositol alpha-1,6-mannosyltransferase